MVLKPVLYPGETKVMSSRDLKESVAMMAAFNTH